MKNKKIFFSLLLFLFILLISNICFAGDLDLIHDYTITIDPRIDGSLDISYHFEWEVLDSTTEGPLTWVKIGIPNANVNGISSSSKCVRTIRYYDTGGDYIRIDFREPYYKGDIVKFDFKIHQSYMYQINGNKCDFSFTPGWFNDINVEKLTVLWNAKQVESSNSKKNNSDNYLVWETSLSKGRKYEVKVSYPKSAFNVTESGQATYATKSENTESSSSYSLDSIYSVITLLIVISVISSILSIFTGGGYYRHGGYGYRRHRHRSYSSHRSSCACVSSCACACACAGGGRAGCSKKDFYGTNLRTNKLNKVLNK